MTLFTALLLIGFVYWITATPSGRAFVLRSVERKRRARRHRRQMRRQGTPPDPGTVEALWCAWQEHKLAEQRHAVDRAKQTAQQRLRDYLAMAEFYRREGLTISAQVHDELRPERTRP